MNTNNVKKYAPRARKAFIAAISKQAAKYGITEKKIEAAEKKGDMVLIGDRPFPASVIRPRERLVKRIEQQSFEQVIEHVAYSWLNRLCAIRYMERKGFLDHGRRVLSAADGSAGVPQILEECLDVDLPGLDQTKIRELKLDGNKDEELYRELLLAQCHALHQAMPFLFEAIADESELLLPENLTKTDSLIRDLVESVPDEDWEHIEIIGWLYQFYISEKKDQVIGKVVKSEDIPAATQLFTPNWIVQYLVQNSVGRQWLQTYPDSPLKEKMPYYIEPAEQTQEVQEQLAAITPSEISPESIKVLDPACGSGHILIEAYKVLKAIYEERGYRTRDIPKLILENNLHGLDIDDRSGQLAGFTLMMLAREDDRRVFDRDIRLNVLSIQESEHIDLPALWQSLNLTGEWGEGSLRELPLEEIDPATFSEDDRYQLILRTLNLFKMAKTFGSLIHVPQEDYEGLKELYITLIELGTSKDSTLIATAANQLVSYIHQALLLAQKFDSVIANPPYMSGKVMNPYLKAFTKEKYKRGKSDLFAVFMESAFNLLNATGFNAQVNMHSWMFLSSFEELRNYLLENHTFVTMAHLGARAFSQIGGEVVQTTAWIINKEHFFHYQPTFYRLIEGGEDEKKNDLLNRRNGFAITLQDDFKKIPGSPFAYWVDNTVRDSFFTNKSVSDLAAPKAGLTTGDNERYQRYWWEINNAMFNSCARSREEAKSSLAKWFPCNSGGEYRKWYGNNFSVVNWQNDGASIRSFAAPDGRLKASPRSMERYFNEGVTWSKIGSGRFSSRYFPNGHIFDDTGQSVFAEKISVYALVAILCSKPASYFLSMISQTLSFNKGDIARIPIPTADFSNVESLAKKLVDISRCDWNTLENSYEFNGNPMVEIKSYDIDDSFLGFCKKWKSKSEEMRCMEIKINTDLISLYGFNNLIDDSVDLSDISLWTNPVFRYGGSLSTVEVNQRFRSDCNTELVSYMIGCAMGRYSLDRGGLVYAHSGNGGFADLITDGAYNTFLVDEDGIIPLTDQEWFPDDATNRFREFVKVVWGEKKLQENIDFVAESLCLHAIKPKKSESAMDTIRRYMSTQFYKDHLKTYKKRPIYWLFSSGKQKAFECLVYLHRYNEGTLARMRTEYVIPLTSKMATYVQKLEKDKEASSSAAEVKRIEKEIALLHKQQAELSDFDEKLRHYADQRISLDLDDGVKVNYGKFGDLLAEVKAVTGKKPEVIL